MVSCSPDRQPLVPPDSVDEIARAATVMLVDAGGQPYCGGVAVGPRTILTASHCVIYRSQFGAVLYVTRDAWSWGWNIEYALPMSLEPESDFVLLRTYTPLNVWAGLRYASMEVGEGVCMMHSAGGNPYQYDCGVIIDDDWCCLADVMKISGIDTLFFVSHHLYTATIPTQPGASGSGLWDDSGRLAGMCLGKDTVTDNGYYLPISAVLDAMRSTP